MATSRLSEINLVYCGCEMNKPESHLLMASQMRIYSPAKKAGAATYRGPGYSTTLLRTGNFDFYAAIRL